MLQQVVAIFLMLGLLVSTLALLRRRGLGQFPSGLRTGAGKSRQMQVIERMPLSPQHSLHLVSVRNSVFLIGVSPGACQKLGEFSSSGLANDIEELKA